MAAARGGVRLRLRQHPAPDEELFPPRALLFLAIGIYRLQQDVFPNHGGWPVFLLATGLALMVAAANYAPLKVALARVLKKSRR